MRPDKLTFDKKVVVHRVERGGHRFPLVFEAYNRLVYHQPLGSRVIQKKKRGGQPAGPVCRLGFQGFGFRVSGLGLDLGVWGTAFWVCGRGFRLRLRFRFSGFEFRGSGFGFRISGFEFRVFRFGFRISGFGFRIPGFESWVWGFGFRVSNFGFVVSDLGFGVLGFGFRVSGCKSRVPGFGCKAPGELVLIRRQHRV